MTDPGLVVPPGAPDEDPEPHGPDRPVLVVALFAFVVLGVAEITISVAWKPIAEELGRRVADVGFLLVSFSVGYVSGALAQHRVSQRLGTPRVVMVAAAMGTTGAVLYATSGVFGLLALGSLCFGLSASLTDTSLNTYVALRHGARMVSLMTAGFGFGALLGPGLVTVVLARDGSWRVVYVLLAVGEIVLFGAWFALRHRFLPPGALAGEERYRPPAVTPSRALVPVVVLTFFAYVGAEQAFGVWAFWWLTDKGMADTTARIVVTGYWAALAFGRLGVAAIAGRVGPRRILTVGTLGALVCAVVLSRSVPSVGSVALLVAGAGLAGVFPCLVSLTPLRLGATRARAVMGVQFAGASIGASTVPALVGVIQQQFGRSAIGPCLVVVSAVLAGLHLAALRLERGRALPVEVVG